LVKYFDKKIFYLLLQPMRIVPNPMISLAVVLFSVANCFADNEPPPPPPTGPTPIGLPIDSGILVLLVIGLAFAFFRFKISNTNKKTPM
jgi:hypothetical protein